MPPPPIPPNKPSNTNPFYAQSGTSTSLPPAQPAQYSSLADLSKNRPSAQESQRFEYPSPPERQGYNAQAFENGSSAGRSGSTAGAGGRRVPPIPKEGMMPAVPTAPPRHSQTGYSATPPPVPPRATSGYKNYIPAGAQGSVDSATRLAGSGFEKAKEGFNTIATQQRKEQVLTGIGKLGAGAAKLGAKGIYQVGKFTSK